MAPRFEGKTVRLGEGSYVIPALSFRAVQRGYAEGWLTKVMAITQDGIPPTAEEMDALLELGFAALSRNYPEITRDQALDLFDSRNIKVAASAALALTLPDHLMENGAAEGEAKGP